MLCNMLQARLPASIETVYLANPSVSPDEILLAIAFELQLDIDRDASRLEVMQALHDHLLQRHADGKRVVVFVEESQSMPLATLEEIRLLSNLETRNDKLLQIVLFGQPELDINLRQPNIRQLRERITHSFRLEPLNANEIREYLMFRMRAAGYRGPDLFSPAVVKHMARASGGLTRRVNLIADKALLAAFSENTHTVKLKHVDAAVRDSEFSQHEKPRFKPRYAWGAALLLAGAVVGASVYSLIQRGSQTPASAAPAPVAAPAEKPPSSPAESSAASTSKAGVPPPSASPVTGSRSSVTGSKQIPLKTYSYNSPPAVSPKTAKKPIQPTTATASASAQSEPLTKVGDGAAPPPVDSLETRLASTLDWLARQSPNALCIQLLGSNDEQQLKNHLNVISNYIDINKIFVYRTLAKQKPSITVLYGSFASARDAKEALVNLPSFLKENRPILRTVQGVRAEIKQYRDGT
jgi:type II secretory pathway predicted ATPase ExeA/septal ring-binding cell division protein DamX